MGRGGVGFCVGEWSSFLSGTNVKREWDRRWDRKWDSSKNEFFGGKFPSCFGFCANIVKVFGDRGEEDADGVDRLVYFGCCTSMITRRVC